MKRKDDLEAYVKTRSRREPGFRALLAAAEQRRVFATTLAKERQQRGLTQTAVAARMHTSPSMVIRIESGADVRLSTVERYAAALGAEIQLGLRRSAARRPARVGRHR